MVIYGNPMCFTVEHFVYGVMIFLSLSLSVSLSLSLCMCIYIYIYICYITCACIYVFFHSLLQELELGDDQFGLIRLSATVPHTPKNYRTTTNSLLMISPKSNEDLVFLMISLPSLLSPLPLLSSPPSFYLPSLPFLLLLPPCLLTPLPLLFPPCSFSLLYSFSISPSSSFLLPLFILFLFPLRPSYLFIPLPLLFHPSSSSSRYLRIS